MEHWPRHWTNCRKFGGTPPRPWSQSIVARWTVVAVIVHYSAAVAKSLYNSLDGPAIARPRRASSECNVRSRTDTYQMKMDGGGSVANLIWPVVTCTSD